jgi:hypothetical protein
MDGQTNRNFIFAARKNYKAIQGMAMEMCRDILLKTDGKRVQFYDENEDNKDMPCTNVAQNCVTDDVVSANVRAIWLDKQNGIHAELSYYYWDGEIEEQFIENDEEFDWLEILDWLSD